MSDGQSTGRARIAAISILHAHARWLLETVRYALSCDESGSIQDKFLSWSLLNMGGVPVLRIKTRQGKTYHVYAQEVKPIALYDTHDSGEVPS